MNHGDVHMHLNLSSHIIVLFSFFSIDLKVLSIEIVDILQTILPNEQEVSCFTGYTYI